MEEKRWWEKLEIAIGRAQTGWSFLQALIGTTLLGYFGIDGDFPPFLIIFFCITTLSLILICLSILPTKRLFLAGSLSIAMVQIGAIGYALRLQHNAEAKKIAEQQALFNSYSLDPVDVQVNFVRRSQAKNLAVGAHFFLKTNNDYDFPIWFRVERRSFTVNNIAGDVSEDRYPVLHQNSNSLAGIPSGLVTFPNPIVVDEIAIGTVDYQVCYGRRRDKLDKSFIFRTSLRMQITGSGDILATYDEPFVRQGSC